MTRLGFEPTIPLWERWSDGCQDASFKFRFSSTHTHNCRPSNRISRSHCPTTLAWLLGCFTKESCVRVFRPFRIAVALCRGLQTVTICQKNKHSGFFWVMSGGSARYNAFGGKVELGIPPPKSDRSHGKDLFNSRKRSALIFSHAVSKLTYRHVQD